MPGRFVTLEGGEAVGKSTQARRLAAALRVKGHQVVETREPGGSHGAESIRALLLAGDIARWSPEAEALLFAAARSDHVARTIRPAVGQDKWVLCDRFVDSSIVYQGMVGEVGEDRIMALHAIGSRGLLPDRTLLLHLDWREAAARMARRDGPRPDRFGARGEAFHCAVNAAFERRAAADPRRIRLVDAGGDEQTVTARLLAEIEDLL